MIITLKSIEIADSDLSGIYDWYTGAASCIYLGDKWRLPTKEELNEMWKRRAKIGGFIGALYWSASEDDETFAWVQSFSSARGYQDLYNKHYYAKVRPVRGVAS